MRSQYHYLVFLTTTLLVGLTSQSSLAFRITPNQPGDSDGTYRYEQFYEDDRGVTRLDAWPDGSPGKPFPPDPRRLLRGQVLEIKPGGTDLHHNWQQRWWLCQQTTNTDEVIRSLHRFFINRFSINFAMVQ